MTFAIPSTLLVKTEDLDAPVGNITFEALTDPSAEAARSLVGGSTRSSGVITSGTTATGNCISFVADSVFIEIAENVVSGSLSDVNANDGSFRVSGALVRMNPDARWPAKTRRPRR